MSNGWLPFRCSSSLGAPTSEESATRPQVLLSGASPPARPSGFQPSAKPRRSSTGQDPIVLLPLFVTSNLSTSTLLSLCQKHRRRRRRHGLSSASRSRRRGLLQLLLHCLPVVCRTPCPERRHG